MFKNWIQDIRRGDLDSIFMALFGAGLVVCIIALTIILSIVIFVSPGYTHEGGPNGVYHMTEPSGDIVKQWHCHGAYAVWGIDTDGDMMVDQCIGNFVTHDRFHLFPVKQGLSLNPATRKMDPGCTCKPAITEQGGDL